MQYETIRNVVVFRGFGKPNAPTFLREFSQREFTASGVYEQHRGHEASGVNADFRNSSQLGVTGTHPFVADAARAVQKANDEYFRINVDAYNCENSLVKYGPGGFFKPHTDVIWPMQSGNHNQSKIRKLTAIMLISETTDFEGGQLRIWHDNVRFRVPFEQGDMIIFPAYTRHVVDQVTSGVRYSLVMWSHGYF